MKTRILISAVLVLAISACDDPVDEFRDAAPSAQGIDIKMRGAKGQALVGDPALMPGVTALATFAVNAHVAVILGTVAYGVSTKPASATRDRVEWRDVTRPLWKDVFNLTMTRTANGFEYVVEGKPKSGGTYVQFMTGVHRPGLSQATGEFTMDFAAMQGLASPPNTVGSATVKYTRTGKDITVDIAFHQTGKPNGTERVDSRYAFSQVEGGEGFFEFVVDSDYDKASPALERLTVKSRWHWDGDGRSDVIGSGGDLSGPFTFSECWDNALNRTYYGDTLGLFPTEGAETDCTYGEASYSRL
ncbi:MAG: hypothetical protein AB1730_03230 [Myxococcota bacterium]|jgi:hypothetical protein